ncbi:hypothetical protein [Phycicoccus flavus]|uniref:hypothetical protein n=1 Tax=Phycicoccus flavus TaxID=2502783 RepID=UPI000FEB9578|nr:hypothetical protein [Phycicoccus flavus]NHA68952.1 hypothetical protein [Phycicoccus flavus]
MARRSLLGGVAAAACPLGGHARNGDTPDALADDDGRAVGGRLAATTSTGDVDADEATFLQGAAAA